MMQVFGHLSFENVLVLLVVLEVVFIRPFHLTYFMLEALVEWVLDTGADGPSFVDPVVDQALNYLGHFDFQMASRPISCGVSQAWVVKYNMEWA